MTTRKAAWLLVLIALLLFVPASLVEARGKGPAPGLASGGDSPKVCSLATLEGAYGFFEQGTYVGKIGQFPPGPFPVAIAGSISYDGAGNLSGTYTGSFGGYIASASFTGTYLVDPDCTYSDEFSPGPGLVLHTAGSISGEGMFQEIHYVGTDAGIVMSGTSRKTRPEGCSLDTLKGDYALFGEGTVSPQLFTLPSFRVARSGLISFDGAGNFSGELTASANGLIVPNVTFTGTYTVESDCTTTAEIHNSLGQTAHEFGAISGNAALQEVHLVVTDPLWVFEEVAKRQ
ncbi:MAG: hypothetical protein ACE145_16845 [Terriglobia bacterium]